MSYWVTGPIVQSLILPLAVSIVVAGVIWFGIARLSPATGRVAALGVALGFLASYWVTVGPPPFPPVSSSHKVAYIVLAGLILGGVMTSVQPLSRLALVAMALWPGVIAAWLGWRELMSPSAIGLITLVGAWVVGAIALYGLRPGSEANTAPSVKLIAAALTAAVIAQIGSSASIAQLCIGLAAATGGTLLLNWPKHRFGLGPIGAYGGGSALIALVTAMALFSNASKLALVLLLLIFFVDRILPRQLFASRPALAAVGLGGACLVPAAIAVIAAYFMSGGGSGYAAAGNTWFS